MKILKSIIVGENDKNQKMDKFMKKFFRTMPSSFIYKSLRKGRVKINSKKARDTTILNAGDKIDFYINDEFFVQENYKNDFLESVGSFDILYEDENIILVNKKTGIRIHNDKDNDSNTLVAQLKKYLFQKGEYNPETENIFSPAFCNRIDVNTSGIVVAAKNAEALRVMNEKIKNREVDKYYLCVICGEMSPRSGELVGYHTKDSKNNIVHISKNATGGSKKVITQYETLKSLQDISLVKVHLVTGKSHQIRAHFESEGHPLLGDTKYGNRAMNEKFKMKYQALCSYKLVFSFTTDGGILSYLTGKEVELGNVEFVRLFTNKFK